jgi:uncharacterized membrane protein (UPF0127 family)
MGYNSLLCRTAAALGHQDMDANKVLTLASLARPSRLVRALACTLAFLLAAPALLPRAAAQAVRAQAPLPISTLQAGIHLIKAEVAADAGSRATGLMFRESLAPNHGMLFVFPEKAGHCFWMRNTLIALSIAFLDDDGSIVNIEDMAPRTETSHCPARAVKFALEMEQGWVAKRGIAPGAKLVNAQLFPGTR